MIRMKPLTALALLLCVALLPACSEPGGAGDNGSAAHPGEEIYNRYCFSCHASGVAGAPRFGDAEAWAPRIAKGPAVLLQATQKGVPPGMPAMGLCTTCTAQDLEVVIDYMVQAAK